MAVQLFFSNQLDLLSAKYAETLQAYFQHTRNIFQAPLTLVPNANLGKWLQLELARRHGVCLNSDFTFLEDGLWRMLETLSADNPLPLRRDGALLQMLVLRTLGALSPGDALTEPLSAYIEGGGASPAAGRTARLWQLSEKLAHLFGEYEYHREEMIQAWQNGPPATEPLERAQQAIYLSCAELQERLAAQGRGAVLSLNAFARRVLQKPAGQVPLEHAPWVHCFGLSQISAFHIGLLERLAPYYEIFIYALNPSREFWEDTLTPGEQRWILRKQAARLKLSQEELQAGELEHSESHPLLAQWGKPGREHIRMLCRLSDYDFHACHGDPGPVDTVLKAVQHSVLSLTLPTSVREGLSQDRSLQVVACPGIFREVATVYNSILHNLERQPHLALTDIAVLVPDMARYKPVVDYIFKQAPRSLVYNLVDSQAVTDSHYAQAVLGLLELAGGRFSRREVFHLLLNPCVMARHGYTADEVAAWVRWAEKLNIFHAYDRTDKSRRGYHDSSRYTWLQGLRRLRLSRVMASPAQTGDPRAHFKGLSPYSDLDTGDDESLARFGLLVDLLQGSVETLNGPSLPGRQWQERVTGILDELLAVPDDRPGEAGVRRRLFENLAALAWYDLPGAGVMPAGSPEHTADIHDAAPAGLTRELVDQFLRSVLEGIPGGVGEYLTFGVTVSALLPMRPIPFKIVYVLGMEEGGFPGRENRFALDLRRQQRRIGDISVPERNRYLFLELLMAVREKLYISYIAKDLVKDREMQPCAVVHQLLRFVEDCVLAGDAGFRQTAIPLKGESPAYLAPHALNAWSDAMVNYRIADRLACYRRQGATGDLTRADEPDGGNLSPGGPPRWPRREGSAPGTTPFPGERISLGQLKRFLQNPAAAKLAWHLDLGEAETEIELRAIPSDEPLFSEFPHDHRLLTASLDDWLEGQLQALASGRGQGPALRETIQGVYDHLQRRGDLPEGGFAQLDFRHLQDRIRARGDLIRPLLPKMARATRLYRRLALGDGDEQGGPLQAAGSLAEGRFPPVCLAPDGPRDLLAAGEGVCLHGELPWVWQAPDNTWHALAVTGREKAPGPLPDKHVLGPVLFALTGLSGIAGQPLDSPLDWVVHGIYGRGRRSWRYHLSAEDARVYLRELIQALGDAGMVEWLPFDTVSGKAKGPFREALVNDVDPVLAEIFQIKLAEDLENTQLGDLLRLAAPEVPDQALELALNRLGVFIGEAYEI